LLRVCRRIGVLVGLLCLPVITSAQANITASVGFGSVAAETTNSFVSFYNGNPSTLTSPQSPTNSGPFSCAWPNTVSYFTSADVAVTFNTATAGTYSGHCSITYRAVPDGPMWVTVTVNATATCTGNCAPFVPESGFVSPKYMVLSVIYAPPGSKSTVDYGNSTNMGTSTSVANSFTNQTSLSVMVGRTLGGPLAIDGATVNLPTVKISTTQSTTDTQEQDTSSSVAFNKLGSKDIIEPGPASNSVGVDHDFDSVVIWLNPILAFNIPAPNTLQWVGNYFDDSDINDMDIITLQVAQLKNPSMLSMDQLNQLSRSWAPNMSDGSAPGLTSADLLAIATADPFSASTYSPSVTPGQPCTTDGRFCAANTNSPIQYASPALGGQPGTTKYSQGYTTTATQGETVKDTHQTTFTVDTAESGGFFVDWTLDVKNSHMLTFMNQWSSQTSQTTGQTITTSITSPLNSDNYTGPTQFALYQDNVYGTLAFFPEAFPGFVLAATPAAHSVTVGDSISFGVSTSVVDGFTGNVALTAAGLPANTTASFSPSTIAAGGSSTLTLHTATTTPSGTYTVTVNGVNGSNLPHSVQVTLTVLAGKDFSLTATPTSHSLTVGQQINYQLAVAALNGFTGAVVLTASGAPAGVTVTISPASITTSGTATVTVAAAASTAPGGYTILLKGTSGTLSHTANITLAVLAATKDFSIAITPVDSGINAGSSAMYTVTITPINGFTGTVSLGLTGVPTNASGTYSPTSIVNGGSSTLTVQTATNTPVGNYTLTAKGTSGSLSHSANATLTVNAP
jgi:hypothetical protein